MKTLQRVCTSSSYYKLLKTWCDLYQRTTNKDIGNIKNIQKEYLERDRVVPYVTDIIILYLNPDGDC